MTQNRNPYQEVVVFREAVEGGDILGIITSRKFGGITRFSISLQREYTNKEGEKIRAPWFDSRHMVALRKILDETEERLQIEEDRHTPRRVTSHP